MNHGPQKSLASLARLLAMQKQLPSSIASDCSSVEDSVVCPDCKGKGKVLAMFIKYEQGHSGPPFKEVPCHFCNGARRIPSSQLDWIKTGKEIRQFRRTNDLTLGEAAELWGIKVSEVSRLERGKDNNENWMQRFGVADR